jgi:hypothetical protein
MKTPHLIALAVLTAAALPAAALVVARSAAASGTTAVRAPGPAHPTVFTECVSGRCPGVGTQTPGQEE